MIEREIKEIETQVKDIITILRLNGYNINIERHKLIYDKIAISARYIHYDDYNTAQIFFVNSDSKIIYKTHLEYNKPIYTFEENGIYAIIDNVKFVVIVTAIDWREKPGELRISILYKPEFEKYFYNFLN